MVKGKLCLEDGEERIEKEIDCDVILILELRERSAGVLETRDTYWGSQVEHGKVVQQAARWTAKLIQRMERGAWGRMILQKAFLSHFAAAMKQEQP